MTILFILRLGQVLNAGFDQVFNLHNPLVFEVADIIDTHVHRVGILSRKYEFATAAGLLKNRVGCDPHTRNQSSHQAIQRLRQMAGMP